MCNIRTWGSGVASPHVCYLIQESTGVAWLGKLGRGGGTRCRSLSSPVVSSSLPHSGRLLSTVGQCPKEFLCSSAQPATQRTSSVSPTRPARAREGEMHDPLLDDCFSFSRGAPFRDAAIASAAEYVDISFLKRTFYSPPEKKYYIK